MLIDYFLCGFVIVCFTIVLCFVIGIIISRNKSICDFKSKEDDFDLTDYASKKEKMLLQPIITNDTPKIISNGDGSFYSDERIEGKSYGTLALSDKERVSFAESGWHDTGLVNGHGQPLVQNDEGKILSVCRMYTSHSHICGVSIADKNINEFTNVR